MLARRALERFPKLRLINGYGPTECSDDVTHQPVLTPPELGAPRVPIGRPLRRSAVLRVRTTGGRRLSFADLRPATAAAIANAVCNATGVAMVLEAARATTNE